jgi:hypothetical protein
MQRRSLLKLGLASAATLALVGGGFALFHATAWRSDRLTDVGRRVLAAVARAVLDGSLPTLAEAQLAALNSHLDRMDATIRELPTSIQTEVGDLLALLDSAPGRLALTGMAPDWSAATVTQLQDALQTMRTSRIDLRKQAYHALRDLTHAAYFASAATWTQLGYPGPIQLA